MTRFKFVVFAVIALAVWALHLSIISPLMAARATDQLAAGVTGAQATLALKLEAQRSELQGAVAALASSGVLIAKAVPKPELPTAERFAQLNGPFMEALSEGNRANAVMGVVNEAGSVWAQGTAAPGPAPIDVDALSRAAQKPNGTVGTIGETSYLFFALPIVSSDKGEAHVAGWVTVGAPVLPDAKGVAEQLAKDFRLAAAAIIDQGKLIAMAGDQKTALEKAALKLTPGQVSALEQGAVEAMGPVSFPMMVSSTARTNVTRKEIAGTSFELAAITSGEEAMQAVVGYQKFGFFVLIGLLCLTIAFAFLIAPPAEEEGTGLVMPQIPLPPTPSRPTPTTGAHEPLSIPEAAPPAEAHPDDFHFPSAPSSSAPPAPAIGDDANTTAQYGSAPPVTGTQFAHQAPAPAPDPEAFAATAVRAQHVPQPPPPSHFVNTDVIPLPGGTAGGPPAAPAVGASFLDDPHGERTVAYPVLKPGAESRPPIPDAFRQASAEMAGTPEATRVAPVPQELMKRAGGGAAAASAPKPGPAPSGSRPPMAAPGPQDEETHFKEVFSEFMATREKCGESPEGLTYDKFKLKLLKNKEQLVSKYACKSVRFQVYVKEGKAALKATPVKD